MRTRIASVLARLHARWPLGLFHGLVFPLLDVVRRWLTPYWYFRRLVRWLMGIAAEGREKMPPFAAELYQAMWLLILVILVVVSPSQIAGWVALFRVYDIAIFSLYWILVSDEVLHIYQRSLAGFMMNLVEVVVLFAVAFMAFSCVSPTARWSAIYNSLRTVVTVGPSVSFTEVPACTALIVAELTLAYTLTVIVVASLAGKMLRAEK